MPVGTKIITLKKVNSLDNSQCNIHYRLFQLKWVCYGAIIYAKI